MFLPAAAFDFLVLFSFVAVGVSPLAFAASIRHSSHSLLSSAMYIVSVESSLLSFVIMILVVPSSTGGHGDFSCNIFMFYLPLCYTSLSLLVAYKMINDERLRGISNKVVVWVICNVVSDLLSFELLSSFLASSRFGSLWYFILFSMYSNYLVRFVRAKYFLSALYYLCLTACHPKVFRWHSEVWFP